MRGLVSSSSSSEDNIRLERSRLEQVSRLSFIFPPSLLVGDLVIDDDICIVKEDSTDTEKKDILDLLKLSYIVVRTGIGTGQIMVTKLFFF